MQNHSNTPSDGAIYAAYNGGQEEAIVAWMFGLSVGEVKQATTRARAALNDPFTTSVTPERLELLARAGANMDKINAWLEANNAN